MNEHGGWICPYCGEMNNLPTGARCDCEQDEPELEYMPIWATIAGPMERLDDEWIDKHERNDSEGWDDES